MQYTRLRERPSFATLAMLAVNPTANVAAIPMEDRYGRTVTARTGSSEPDHDVDAVYVCAGNHPVFAGDVIVLAHAHTIGVAAKPSRDRCDGT